MLYETLQDGYTPLHLAAKIGHTTCVNYLLSTPGIDVNIGNKVRISPLKGNRRCNRVLLDWDGICRIGTEWILKEEDWVLNIYIFLLSENTNICSNFYIEIDHGCEIIKKMGIMSSHKLTA